MGLSMFSPSRTGEGHDGRAEPVDVLADCLPVSALAPPYPGSEDMARVQPMGVFIWDAAELSDVGDSEAVVSLGHEWQALQMVRIGLPLLRLLVSRTSQTPSKSARGRQISTLTFSGKVADLTRLSVGLTWRPTYQTVPLLTMELYPPFASKMELSLRPRCLLLSAILA